MDYTEKLQKEIERVTLRGNADKDTIRVLASIIFDMNMRIEKLTAKPAETVQAPTPVKTEPEATAEVDLDAVSGVKKVLSPQKTKG